MSSTNMTNKYILSGIAVLAILGATAFFGYSPFTKQTVQQIFNSPVGATFNSAKVAEIAMAPISSAATSSSLYNGDASARIIDSGFVSCATSTGAVMGSTGGVASWTWQMATTATNALGLQGNTNYAMNLTVSTSTTDNEYTASSTNPALVMNRYWPSGSYLTINTNATTTNGMSVTCQAGVYYHGT
jgi:hypothetical protein